MRIALITDAWVPQVNGVVTTLKNTCQNLEEMGHIVKVISPLEYRTVPMPTYPEIRLALTWGRKIANALDDFQPEAIHIATEGPLGFFARRYCLKKKFPFSTAYHTDFPRYVRGRLPIDPNFIYHYLRWFHRPAVRTMVPSPSQQNELHQHRFPHLVLWSRGVNTDLFRPYDSLKHLKNYPVFIYVGRLAVEKNLEAFLDLDLPGEKHLVGEGPDFKKLKARYTEARFHGYHFGESLARLISAADVFVFPSKTDTFGLVMLEALACGVPVAAYPVKGPIDVIEQGVTGVLDEDLKIAALEAMKLDRMVCRQHALARSWEKATTQFFNHLAPFNHSRFAV